MSPNNFLALASPKASVIKEYQETQKQGDALAAKGSKQGKLNKKQEKDMDLEKEQTKEAPPEEDLKFRTRATDYARAKDRCGGLCQVPCVGHFSKGGLKRRFLLELGPSQATFCLQFVSLSGPLLRDHGDCGAA